MDDWWEWSHRTDPKLSACRWIPSSQDVLDQSTYWPGLRYCRDPPRHVKKNKITTEGRGRGRRQRAHHGRTEGRGRSPGTSQGRPATRSAGCDSGVGPGGQCLTFLQKLDSRSWTKWTQKCKMDREGSASALRAFSAVCVVAVGPWILQSPSTRRTRYARALDTFPTAGHSCSVYASTARSECCGPGPDLGGRGSDV